MAQRSRRRGTVARREGATVDLSAETASYADGLARMLRVSRDEAMRLALDEAMLVRSRELRHFRLALLIANVGGAAALAALVETSARSVQRWRLGTSSPSRNERAALARVAQTRGLPAPYPMMDE